MAFALVCILMLAVLGVVAAVASLLSKGGDDDVITTGGQHDCSTCVSADDGSCQLRCLMEQKKRNQRNKTPNEAVI